MKTDGQLLTAYAKRDSQEAFAELVRRHGPMVEATCRRRLGPEAEDAFQAVFVLLARKAAALSGRSELGPWLYRACGFVTRSSIRERKRRRHHEKEAADMKKASASPAAIPSAEQEIVARHVDDAVSALPARFRRVVILCYLEGATQQQAAERLRLPLGTVAWRCSRGLEKLRGKLERRGVTLGAAALGSLLLAEASSAAPSFSLLPSALAAPKIAAAGASAGTAAISAAIAEGAIKMMFWAKTIELSAIAGTAAITTAVLVTVGAMLPAIAGQQSEEPPKKRARVAAGKTAEPADQPRPATPPGKSPAVAAKKVPVRLKLLKIEGQGARRRYVFDVVKTSQPSALPGPVTVTVGAKPGELRYSLADGRSGTMQAGEAAVSGLAWLMPGVELALKFRLDGGGDTVGMESSAKQAHFFNLVATSTGYFQLVENRINGSSSFRLIHTPFGRKATIPGYGMVDLPLHYRGPLSREEVQRLRPAVLTRLRSLERQRVTRDTALARVWSQHVAKPEDRELLDRAVAAYKAYAKAERKLKDATEGALRKALGASYSKRVTVDLFRGDEVTGDRVSYLITVDGVNRPLAEYASQLPAGLLTVAPSIADASTTLCVKKATLEVLASELARAAGGRAVRHGKAWHIAPRQESPREEF